MSSWRGARCPSLRAVPRVLLCACRAGWRRWRGRGHGRPKAATAQAGPPCQGSRGALPHACLGAPACPFLPSQLSAAGRAPELGAGLRDAVLSPGSCESESFLFLAYIICVDGEHCESPSSLHASPGRTDAPPEPGSPCSAPSFTCHNGRSMAPTVTSPSPPHGRGPLASKQEGGSSTKGFSGQPVIES